MMVLQDATRTNVAQTLANTDDFSNIVTPGRTTYRVQNAAALDAIREGAQPTAESARYDSTALNTADITIDRDVITVAGLRRAATPTTPVNGRTFQETSTANQSRVPITDNLALDAIDAGVFTLQRVTAGSPAVEIGARLEGSDIILDRPITNAGATINIRYSNPAYTTAGAPRGVTGFAIDYNTPAYQQVAHRVYPADRCTWVQENTAESGGGYHIRDAQFHGTATAINISEPVLGVIGKTGRFVAITNTR